MAYRGGDLYFWTLVDHCAIVIKVKYIANADRGAIHMVIECYNLNPSELRSLREFEDKNPNDVILSVCNNAFSGEVFAEIIAESLGIITAIGELVLLWKENRKRKTKGNTTAELAAKTVEIIIKYPDGKELSMKLSDVTKDVIEKIVNGEFLPR